MEILHQDKDLAVIVKPVGLDSQAAVPEELQKQLDEFMVVLGQS